MWCYQEAGEEGQARGGSFGALAAANPGLAMATSQTLCSLAHLGSSGANPLKVGLPIDPRKRQMSTGALPRAG